MLGRQPQKRPPQIIDVRGGCFETDLHTVIRRGRQGQFDAKQSWREDYSDVWLQLPPAAALSIATRLRKENLKPNEVRIIRLPNGMAMERRPQARKQRRLSLFCKRPPPMLVGIRPLAEAEIGRGQVG